MNGNRWDSPSFLENLSNIPPSFDPFPSFLPGIKSGQTVGPHGSLISSGSAVRDNSLTFLPTLHQLVFLSLTFLI